MWLKAVEDKSSRQGLLLAYRMPPPSWAALGRPGDAGQASLRWPRWPPSVNGSGRAPFPLRHALAGGGRQASATSEVPRLRPEAFDQTRRGGVWTSFLGNGTDGADTECSRLVDRLSIHHRRCIPVPDTENLIGGQEPGRGGRGKAVHRSGIWVCVLQMESKLCVACKTCEGKSTPHPSKYLPNRLVSS